MAVILEAFPKLSRELLTKIGYISAEYEFYYHNHGEKLRLDTETTSSSTSKTAVLQLTDPVAQWHPEEYELCIDLTSIINVPVFLFGEKGLAASDGGIIGIAVMWMAPDSNSRGVIPVGEISRKSMAPYVLHHTIRFSSKMLRGTLILQNILYVKHRGNPEGIEKYQAGEPGTILGILDETRVIIDGNGSIFPIHEMASPANPLWWVTCNWSDATEDKFTDENFCIYLNSAHKDFAALNSNEGIQKSPLLLEIVCSALEILVSKVMGDPVAEQAVRTGEHMLPGSIASVVNFFIHRFDWHIDKDNPQQLAMDIRMSLMKAI